MLNIRLSTRFKRDVRRMEKQRADISLLTAIMNQLAAEEKLDPKHRDHVLSGGWAGMRECHILPDWLLIYQSNETDILFQATGSHSDLFE